MKETIKNGVSVGAPLALATVLAIALVHLDNYYKWPLKDEEIAQIAAPIAGALWAVWWVVRSLLVIVYRGLRNRLERWAGPEK